MNLSVAPSLGQSLIAQWSSRTLRQRGFYANDFRQLCAHPVHGRQSLKKSLEMRREGVPTAVDKCSGGGGENDGIRCEELILAQAIELGPSMLTIRWGDAACAAEPFDVLRVEDVRGSNNLET